MSVSPQRPAWVRFLQLALVLGLLLVTLIWLRWFLTVPLPSVNSIQTSGPPLTRIRLLWAALPQAIAELDTPRFLVQRVPIALSALLIAVSAWALGRLTLRALRLTEPLVGLERLVASTAIGLVLLELATQLIGRIAVPAPSWALAILLAPPTLLLILSLWDRFRRPSDAPDAIPQRSVKAERRPEWRSRAALGFVLVTGPIWMFMALAAMLPTIEFDALEYHLQGPKEYAQAGLIQFLPHNVYTSMPFGVEMLHLLGMALMDDWWLGALVGKAVIGLHAPLATLFVALTARRLGGPEAGWIAGLAYATTPWVYRLGINAFVEGPLCAAHAGLIWAAWRVHDLPEDRRWGGWAMLGVLAGGAFSIKYPALLTAVVPAGLWALAGSLRARRVGPLLIFATAVTLVAAPWLIKNLIETGNPVYPLAYEVFGSHAWDATREARWQSAHGPRERNVETLLASMIDVLGRSDWQGPLYAVLVPLAWLRLLGRSDSRSGTLLRGLDRWSRRGVVLLTLHISSVFLIWWGLTHRVDRFWLPLLPGAAILAGLGFETVRGRGWTVGRWLLVSTTVVVHMTIVLTPLAGLNEWTRDYRALRRELPANINPPLAALGQSVGPEQRVLILGQAQVFYVEVPHLYSTVFDESLMDRPGPDGQPPTTELLRRRLRAQGVTHLYVDWEMIARYRSPGNYGFSPAITRERLAGWVSEGLLQPPRDMSQSRMHQMYRVRP